MEITLFDRKRDESPNQEYDDEEGLLDPVADQSL